MKEKISTNSMKEKINNMKEKINNLMEKWSWRAKSVA